MKITKKSTHVKLPAFNESCAFKKVEVNEVDSSKAEILDLKAQIRLKEEEISHLLKKNEELEKKNKSQSTMINEMKVTINSLKEKLDNKNETTCISSSCAINKIELLESSNITQMLTNKKNIGQGATSTVYKVTREENYALKSLNINFIIKKKENNEDEDEESFDFDKIRRFFGEYDAINSLNHPNIIKTFGFFMGDKVNPPSILLEYCPHSLKSYIKKLGPSDRARVIVELSDAMEHVHRAGIIHRDLKPENILLDRQNHAKVSDFGLCTLIKLDTDTTSRTQMSGTLQFMAPELLQGRTDYDEKVDVYAFGVVVYFVVSGGEYPLFNLADIVNGKQFPIPSTFRSVTQKILNKCFAPSPNDRPSFKKLHEALKKFETKLIRINDE